MNYENFDYDMGLGDFKQEHERMMNPDRKSGSNNFVRFDPNGATTIRILPPAPGKKLCCATRLHKVEINGEAKHYHCLRVRQPDGRWFGDCPLCSEYGSYFELAKVAKTQEEADKLRDIGRKLKPYERYYYAAIVRKEYDKEKEETLYNVGPKIASLGEKLQARILRAIFGDAKLEEPALGNIAHPYKGRDFKVIGTSAKSADGRNTFTNYDTSKFLEVSVLGTAEEIDKWMNNLPDLQALRDNFLKTPEELQAIADQFSGRKSVVNSAADFKPVQNEVQTRHEVTQSVSIESDDTPPFDVSVDDDMGHLEDDFIRELQRQMGNS